VSSLEETRSELRRTFDEGFREPLRDAAVEHEDLLAIRVGGDAYALRLSDVLGLHNAALLAPVPSAVPEFLGLLGVRGLLAPVYDLGRLLGYSQQQAPRWVALVRSAHSVGFAFPKLEAHVRVPLRDSSPERETRTSRPARDAVRLGATLHTIIDVRALTGALPGGTRVNGAKEPDR
jgi:purine-binding chemotaxis protein CheW